MVEWLHSFLTSPLDVLSGLLHAPGRFTSRERAADIYKDIQAPHKYSYLQWLDIHKETNKNYNTDYRDSCSTCGTFANNWTLTSKNVAILLYLQKVPSRTFVHRIKNRIKK